MTLLFDFLLSAVKQRIVKELAHGDLQPVADLFDGYNAGVLALLVEHTVDGRRRHAADIRQRVDGDVPLVAQIDDALCYRFFRRHGRLLCDLS